MSEDGAATGKRVNKATGRRSWVAFPPSESAPEEANDQPHPAQQPPSGPVTHVLTAPDH